MMVTQTGCATLTKIVIAFSAKGMEEAADSHGIDVRMMQRHCPIFCNKSLHSIVNVFPKRKEKIDFSTVQK